MTDTLPAARTLLKSLAVAHTFTNACFVRMAGHSPDHGGQFSNIDSWLIKNASRCGPRRFMLHMSIRRSTIILVIKRSTMILLIKRSTIILLIKSCFKMVIKTLADWMCFHCLFFHALSVVVVFTNRQKIYMVKMSLQVKIHCNY